MIDKGKRKAIVEQNGNMFVVRMTGGPDCLWLNVYLDAVDWQMTCDSDIGSYAYNWGRPHHDDGKRFIDFCLGWLSKEDWLLRKCIGERHVDLDFDVEKTKKNLFKAFEEENGENCDTYDFVEVLEAADGYSENAGEWAAALDIAADRLGVELPEEWWCYIVKGYTPWQKRFAEICREVIVPELKKLADEGAQDGGADNG